MMHSPWNLVNRRYWDPISQLEQSFNEMEEELLTSNMLHSHRRFPFQTDFLALPRLDDDDEFFRDLPTGVQQMPLRGEQQKKAMPHRETQESESQSQSQTNEKRTKTETKAKGKTAQEERAEAAAAAAAAAESNASRRLPRPQQQFSSYAYSSSSVIDDCGRRVQSIRRRYEDSNGRLKAEHKRSVGDKVMTNQWIRQPEAQAEAQTEAQVKAGAQAEALTEAQTQEEGGEFKKTITGDIDEEEFEELWKDTPFARAAREKSITPGQ